MVAFGSLSADGGEIAVRAMSLLAMAMAMAMARSLRDRIRALSLSARSRRDRIRALSLLARPPVTPPVEGWCGGEGEGS